MFHAQEKTKPNHNTYSNKTNIKVKRKKGGTQSNPPYKINYTQA